MSQTKVSTEDQHELRLYEIRTRNTLMSGGSIGLRNRSKKERNT